MTRFVHCAKLDQDLPGLDFPPVPGELGQKIWRSISRDAWEQWKQLQTMMINEYGINCSDPAARKHLMQQCETYLFGKDAPEPEIPNRTPAPEAPKAAEEPEA